LDCYGGVIGSERIITNKTARPDAIAIIVLEIGPCAPRSGSPIDPDVPAPFKRAIAESYGVKRDGVREILSPKLQLSSDDSVYGNMSKPRKVTLVIEIEIDGFNSRRSDI
jgi:hypothetical protein